MALSASAWQAFVNNSIDSSRLCAITGSITLSWKLPDWPATVMVVSLPITCAATIVTASGITGLTFPGMIEEPGCKPCSSISPNPAKGPEFIQRKSLAIFISATAAVFN
ncbi:Uncharacterised protein [Vibrio cholerae]|nr:Uncharacterised protein [Vibrio cholerae]CRZ69615.1 Uncharacterised protein [Vibrio cholerae]CSB93489.1 Uncharacterised protein [Vibrio cholerae]CSC45766.1 Uncharacterised protein [Vibrio cholerae]CSD34751.1 Uncharacterised protein [Vibrio cholerae]